MKAKFHDLFLVFRNLLAGLLLAGLACINIEAQEFSQWSKPVNLGPSFNTEFSEFHPAISSDQLTIFFASDRPGTRGRNDLWVAQRASRSANWSRARNIGPRLNTDGAEAGPELSADGHWLFFCSDGPAADSVFNLYATFRADVNDNFGWRKPFNLGERVNGKPGKQVNCDPTTFVDPQDGVTTLYFARLKGPNHGDWDIYMTTFTLDGKFSFATLVPELSGPYRDTHPTFRRDGLEIIFSSNRPGSLGGIDLWGSTRKSIHHKWSKPVHLDGDVNTIYQDRAPYLSDNGRTLILVSDRPGGFGGNDLYSAKRKKLR